MKIAACILLCAMLLILPITAADWLDTGELNQALTQEEKDLIGGIDAEQGDVSKGFSGLFNGALSTFRGQLKSAVSSGFLSLAICAVLSLAEGFSKSAGLTGASKAAELTAICGLLIVSLAGSGGLVSECEASIRRLDLFSKTLTTTFAAAGAVAGRPISAVAASAATMLFSNVIISLSRMIFLPLTRFYVLACAAGAAAESPLLLRGAQLVKWTASTFYRWFLMIFFGYVTLSGLITGSADAAAVKTAQVALSGAVPVVGGIIAGASEAILAGAKALRAGIGLFGCLGAAAICLTPFLQAFTHLLIYKLLAAFAASFASSGAQKLLDGIADAYGIALGLLGTCCAVQFIAIVASLTVAGA
ncbi:MAG: hypothetical protein VB086_13225 [Clostridiaceae bacterium]|nr:hypothetical protein [Clostridiaceae bacterium]